jgi:hypothetical protein
MFGGLKLEILALAENVSINCSPTTKFFLLTLAVKSCENILTEFNKISMYVNCKVGLKVNSFFIKVKFK